MEKELLFLKRKKAREYYNKGWSIRKIARYLHSGKSNVSDWIKLNDEDTLIDNRGWPKGQPRKYTLAQKEKIKKIRNELEKENSYFVGAIVVKNNYEKQTKEPISKDFVDRTLREAGLAKPHKKKRKGVSKYMKYPKTTLGKMGKILMSMDFIGPKYLNGSKDPINFLSCKYIRPEKQGIVRRINGQTTNEAIRILKKLWKNHPIPDAVKVDNDSAFGANIRHERNLGRLAFFFLNLGITPIYLAPRSPWNNGECEGFNSVFSKKFWNRIQFKDHDDIDIKIKKFNVEYELYSKLKNNNPKKIEPKTKIQDLETIDLENKNIKNFKTEKIYFLRIVRRKNKKGSKEEYGFINILKKEIKIPVKYINLFTFCTLYIKTKELAVQIETDDGLMETIKTVPFKIENIKYG